MGEEEEAREKKNHWTLSTTDIGSHTHIHTRSHPQNTSYSHAMMSLGNFWFLDTYAPLF